MWGGISHWAAKGVQSVAFVRNIKKPKHKVFGRDILRTPPLHTSEKLPNSGCLSNFQEKVGARLEVVEFSKSALP